MITVGLVYEVLFLAKAYHNEIINKISLGGDPASYEIKMRVTPKGSLDVWMSPSFQKDEELHIWNEELEGEDSFFGVESVDTISRIIACVENGDNSWRDKYLQRKSLDFPETPADGILHDRKQPLEDEDIPSRENARDGLGVER